ncbi:branched-chain amino acid ABC transporter permease [Castellaniella sp.]|uniref:branched-chain amino acid ABC transporter permease n=1 Tax=Castellaniella sp. TaxID=1955812 RepID=UPI003569B853
MLGAKTPPAAVTFKYGLMIVLAVLPIIGPQNYWVFTLGLSFSFAIIIISVSFLVRYGGEVSIGHGVFAAIGAYTVAMLEKYFSLSLFISLPLGVIAGALAALIVAVPSRRISGIYLTVVTMVVALSLPELLLYFTSFTGGYEGLHTSGSAIEGMSAKNQGYYFPLVGLIFIDYILRNFRASRQAMSLLLSRTSKLAGESFGISGSWSRISCFTISGAIAAFGGGLLAFNATAISPNNFTVWTSFYLLVGSVVSLYSLSFFGGLVGGLFIAFIPILLAGFGDLVLVFYGATLLIVVVGGNVLQKYTKLFEQKDYLK